MIDEYGLAGSFSADVALNVPDASLRGSFSVAINTSLSRAVDEIFLVGANEVHLIVPAGEYIQIIGNGIELDVLGQTLSGNFIFEKQTVDDETRGPVALPPGSA